MSLASAEEAQQPAAAATAVAAECTGQGKFSKNVGKQLGAIQDAVKVQKWADVVAKADEAAADGKPKTAFEEFWLHRFRASGYTGLEQFDKAALEYETISDSPCLVPEEKAAHFTLLVRIYGKLDSYQKVVEIGNRALQLGPTTDMLTYVGQSYYRLKDWPNARRVTTELVDLLEKQGKQPDEQSLIVIQGSCTEMKDTACAMEQFEKMVKLFPKQQHWHNIVVLLLKDPKSTNKQQLDIIRLAMYEDVVKDGQWYCDTAQIAIDEGLPGEAQSILEKGAEQKLFTDKYLADRSKRLLDEAKAAVANDKSTLAQQDAAARANKAGNADVKLGAAYLSYGDSAKAIEAIQRGIGKGGVRDPADANVLLGIAYLRSGNKPEAAKAFQAVTGDAMKTRMARLWLLNT